MIVVGFVATDGAAGMIDAWAARSASIPLGAPWESTTAHGSWGPPIGTVAVGWPREGRLDAITSASWSSSTAAPGHNFELELSERRIAADPAGQHQPFKHPARVL